MLFAPTAAKRILFFLSFDLFISLSSLYFAYLLRFNFEIPREFLENFPKAFIFLVIFKIAFFFVFRIYFISWRFVGLSEAKNILKAHIAAYGAFTLVFLAFSDFFNPFPRSVIIIDFFLSLFFVSVLRISKRIYLEAAQKPSIKNTLIIGASGKAFNIIKSALSGEIDYYPVAIIDDDPDLKNTYFSNLKVHPLNSLETVARSREAQAAIITQDLAPKELDRLFERLKSAGIKEVKLAKILGDIKESLQDLAIEDLLAREPKDLDLGAIKAFLKGQEILITGAGGSIGSEIARQCAHFGAKKLILVDNGEYNLYKIAEELWGLDIAKKLVSVADREKLERVYDEFKPKIVIHAAAYKHVPLCEENIDAAIENNILGTKNVVDLAIKHSVRKVVIISSDKAVRPTNVMGATKRVAELYAQNVPSNETEIVAVRFGNVLDSSGSVVPKFREQIKKGGPVTVTHPEVTRYFMLIPEACQLVLQAASLAKGGEIFILDMGEPVKIADLARKMIRLYGKEDEVGIEFIGLRPGEKLYEELLIDESEQKTRYESIHVARPTYYPIDMLKNDIEELLKADEKIKILKKIVPEFTH